MKINYCLISIVAISLIACQNKATNEHSVYAESTKIILNEEELKSLKILITTIQRKEFAKTLHCKGKIDVPPQNIYLLSVPLGGYLKYTHLLPGMPIKKNEVIAIMEDPQYIQIQEDYLSTKNQLSVSEKNYLRQKELWEQKAVSDKVFEQAWAEYENNKIKLKSLEEKLKLININPGELTSDKISKNINIYAPFTGYVTSVNFSTGKYIPPAEVLFELVNPEDIHLNIKVFDNDLEYLQIGQKVWAYTNSSPEKKYLCEIILINKVVENDGTINVHCHFNKYDESLIPGTFMQADVMVEKSDDYAINAEAVVFHNNKNYVFVQTNNKTFEMTEVQKSWENDKFIGISNYQNLLNKKIVSTNAYALLMKLKKNEEEE